MNQRMRPQDLPEIIGGRYRVLEELGRGGMGRVLKVEHLHTGEILAMKMLLAPAASEHALDRFRREARFLARLRGDYIVRVMDADIASELGNTPYIVMELLEGEDLSSLLQRRGKLEPAEACGLLAQLAIGLARVHKAGLLHRDLKPGNIFLCRRENRVTVKLLDFGLVRAVSASDEMAEQVTREGQTVGTPLFMSPEQVHGSIDAIGPATDIWAVGIIAFHLLTGRVYWNLREMPRGAFDIGAAPLDRPSSRDPSLTVAFDGWFLRSCALNPAARWPDPITQARELAAALGCPEPESLAISHSSGFDGGDSPTVTLVPSEPGAIGRLRRQRRQVTVLFYRLARAGPADAEIDPEDFEAMETRLHAALDEAFGDLSRTSTRLAEGGRFIFFGYPRAHGHDARRAVEAALRLSALARRLGSSVRVGIHTGMVLAGPSLSNPGAPEVTGSALGTAADLEHTAAPGQVLVSEATWQMLDVRFHGRAMGAGIHEVTAISEESEATLSTGAMVGRDAELGLLLSCLEQAQAGETQTALVSGEVGMGKSRLIAALREHASAARAQWLECRCSPYFQGTPFHPLIEPMRALMEEEAAPPDLDEEARQLIEFLVGISSGGASRLQGLSPSTRRERTIQALIALLHRRASASPLILAIEDLHWADPSTIEFIDRLSVLNGVPILTALTARPDFRPSWSSPAAIVPLRLRRLSPAQSAQLIAAIAAKDLPPPVMEMVAQTTSGIPLFIEALTRLVAHSPDLAADAAAGRADIPGTLREALNARLDGLGGARTLAERAAVIGAEFSVDDLRILSDASVDVEAQIRELVKAQILQPRGLPPYRSYAFQHAMLRDAAYDLPRREERRELHARLARAMAARGKAEPEPLAHHFAAGGMPLEAAGCLLQAGQAALERSANAEAREYFERGIDLLRRNQQSNPNLALAAASLEITLFTLKGMAWAVSRGYAVPEAEAAIAAAMDGVKALQRDPTPDLAPALWAHWIFMLVRGRYADAESEGRRLLELAECCGDSGIAMLAHLALGVTLVGPGRFEESVRHLDEALKRYDAAAHGSYRFLYGQDPWMFGAVFKAWALWCLGFADRAADLVTRAVDHAESLHHPNSFGFALALKAIIYHYRGEVEAVEQASRALMDLSMQQGWMHWLGHAKLWSGAAQAMRGNLEEGVAAMREARQFAAQAGERSGATHYDTVLAAGFVRAGRLSEAAEWVAASKQAMCESGEVGFEADLLRVEGEVARLRGDFAAARAFFAQAYASASSKGSLAYRLRAALSMARLEREQDGGQEARTLLSGVLAEFTEGYATADWRAARVELGEVAAR